MSTRTQESLRNPGGGKEINNTTAKAGNRKKVELLTTAGFEPVSAILELNAAASDLNSASSDIKQQPL